MAGRSAHVRRSQELSGLGLSIPGHHGHRRSSSQSDSPSPHTTPAQSQSHLLQVPGSAQQPLGSSPPGGGGSSFSSHGVDLTIITTTTTTTGTGTGASSPASTVVPNASDRDRDHHSTAKRPRAFLTDLLSGSSHPGQTKSGHHNHNHHHLPVVVPTHIIPVARAHLRAESLPSARETYIPSPVLLQPMMANAPPPPPPPPKMQSSPSKVRGCVSVPS